MDSQTSSRTVQEIAVFGSLHCNINRFIYYNLLFKLIEWPIITAFLKKIETNLLCLKTYLALNYLYLYIYIFLYFNLFFFEPKQIPWDLKCEYDMFAVSVGPIK